ncbi:helix-turn-helix domain-containing protein [Sphingomonas sp. NPDC079357]|uniref:helix-turn-helix domain-containing protein n=1 Tax=Sphingomonas sp. NPDC079357 TaxID=3364518 RepID=UPI00384BC62B
MTSRSRLPEGFAAFRDDFGEIIRKKRVSEGWSQQTLADLVGVTRETISRMENGAWPLPDTLYGLMRHLEIDWGDFAVPGVSERPPKRFDGSPRGEDRFHMGQALRKARLSKGWTLQCLAGRCGMSAAQLSRLERGESSRSKFLEDDPRDAELPVEYRRYRFKHPLLRRVEWLGSRD